jgi:hypothetical protein
MGRVQAVQVYLLCGAAVAIIPIPVLAVSSLLSLVSAIRSPSDSSNLFATFIQVQVYFFVLNL